MSPAETPPKSFLYASSTAPPFMEPPSEVHKKLFCLRVARVLIPSTATPSITFKLLRPGACRKQSCRWWAGSHLGKRLATHYSPNVRYSCRRQSISNRCWCFRGRKSTSPSTILRLRIWIQCARVLANGNMQIQILYMYEYITVE